MISSEKTVSSLEAFKICFFSLIFLFQRHYVPTVGSQEVGWTNPGFHYHCAAHHSIKRKKTALRESVRKEKDKIKKKKRVKSNKKKRNQVTFSFGSFRVCFSNKLKTKKKRKEREKNQQKKGKKNDKKEN